MRTDRVDAHRRLLVIAVGCMALTVVGCGTGSSGSVGPAPTPFPTDPCDFGAVRSGIDAVVEIHDVTLTRRPAEKDSVELSVLNVRGTHAVLARSGKATAGEADAGEDPESYQQIFAYPPSAFVVPEALREVPKVGRAVAMTSLQPIRRGVTAQFAFAVGEIGADGSLRLLGSCGAQWTAAMTEAAGRHGKKMDVEFFVTLLGDRYSPAFDEVSNIFTGSR